ncbi:hypothetical protein [Nonomuraea wenchangensis]|uniref:hypothetical protein n=1 Tax=Nonomuraea wenchangensis TaxID=568860 RepID=UPI00344ACD74
MLLSVRPPSNPFLRVRWAQAGLLTADQVVGLPETAGEDTGGGFPWGEAAALYTAKPHGAGLSATPLSPTPDRTGRTMRIAAGATTTLTAPDQKRQWIDLVVPMAVMVVPPADFDAGQRLPERLPLAPDRCAPQPPKP